VTPIPLKEPPEDYGLLTEQFPTVAKENLPAYVSRIHRADHEPEWFSSSGDNRWDPPPSTSTTFGTCYMATDEVTAFIEVFGELPVITRSLVDARCVAILRIRDITRLADMTSGLIRQWGLDRRISVGDDYGVCQRWANALQLAGFNGVLYEPRHDPRIAPIVNPSVALFGDPGYQPTQMDLLHDGIAIEATTIATAERDFGLTIVTGDFLP
jgi:RES domain